MWSTRSAAAGGVTTIVDMPYDDGMLICSGDRLARKAREAGEQARVDFALYGTVFPEEGPMRIAEMVDAAPWVSSSPRSGPIRTASRAFPRKRCSRVARKFPATA